MTTDSFMPNSNQIYLGRDEDGTKVEYFQEVLRTTDGRLYHNIAVGDICAIRDTNEGIKAAPFEKREKWIIGQVLALFVKRVSLEKSTYHVQVRRLARWIQEAPNFATEQALQKAKKNKWFRPEHTLFETMKLETHLLSDVLRADIRLDEPGKFIAKAVQPDWNNEVGAFYIDLCCPLRIGEDDLFHDARKVWNHYENRRTSDATAPPLALAGGWKLLTDENLRTCLKETWKPRSETVFSIRVVAQGKENKRKAAEAGSLKTSLKSKKRRKSSLSVKFTADSKFDRHVPDSDTVDETMTEYSASMTAGDTATETSDEAQMDGSSLASASLNATPLNKPVFETKCKSSASTVYVEGVEMDVDPAAVYSDRLKKKKERTKQRWSFHVGDTVVLRCHQARPPQKPLVSTKSVWYPFRVAVSVVQVVAIYYRDDDKKEIKMQVRWFYRPDELDQNVSEHMSDAQSKEFSTGKYQARMLVEVDEHVNEVPVESAVGHAKLTSVPGPSEKWLRPDLANVVPVVGFICRYIHIAKDDDPILYPVRDWTNCGATSSGPLYRGLHCPKARPGQSKKLLRRYEERICQKLGIKTLTISDIWEEQAETESQVVEWTPREMDLAEASCNTTGSCHSDNYREHFTSVSIPIVKERCDPRGIAKKSEHKEITVSIGDFVCVTSALASTSPKSGHKEGNPWFPFKGPFSYVQVLNIFRKTGKRNTPVMLEVRRFYRRTEIDVSANYLPPDCSKENEEEVFESYDLEVVNAGRVLGSAEVFLGHHAESYTTRSINKSSKPSGISMPKCRCVFFLTKVAVQHLFCADSSAFKWSRRMLERGLTSSSIIRKDPALASSIEYRLGISIASDQTESGNIFQSLIQETRTTPAAVPLYQKKTGSGVVESFFCSVSIAIPWSSFVDGSRLCSRRDRSHCWWKVYVGQVVAVRRDGSSNDAYYKCNWEPAQVIAISRYETGHPSEEGYRFTVKWLHRTGKMFPWRISASSDPFITMLASGNLLGPIYCVANEDDVADVWSSSIRYLPTNIMLYDGAKYYDFSAFVRNGLKFSNLYSGEELQHVFDALEEELPLFSKLEMQTQGTSLDTIVSTGSQASAIAEPSAAGHLYKDAKATTYCKRVVVEVSGEKFVEHVRKGRDRFGPWIVELGDTVVVEYHHGCGRARFGTSCGNGEKKSNYGPLKCAWSVGEVVLIFVENGDVELEIRWFYRAPEIKGAKDFGNQSSIHMSEEIFESDHYDVVPASALLCPATVHEQPVPVRKPRFHLDMPMLDFNSCHFWSPRRKSLLPVESSETARIQRGRLHSPRFQQDAGLQKSLDSVAHTSKTERSSPSGKSWKSSFYDVIQKLSLTDASKEGFKSSKAIVGRDKEMKQVLSFLRTALKGSSKEGHRSLFIAGPPGVGKTACVRAAISELEQFRAAGQVQSFEFVSMNGMEMRYPFEAYVQLWEKISGRTVRPEVAAARLEAYFTKEESIATKEAKSDARSVIVLLDEIDYLVTKTQSVFYNFFDWPTHNQSRRLIVLGVSNTLNLAETLHTRVQSRIGSRRCIFKAYDDKQIGNILRAKLLQASPGYTVFDEDAIVYVSKKTASLSGDIRRAFQICRTAAEHVMRKHISKDGDPVVTIRDALKVSRESFYSAKSQAITRCTAFEALLLVSLASLSKSTGREFGGFDMEEILVKMEALANGLGDARYLPTPTLSEAMDVVSRLAESNIVAAVTPQTTSLTHRASLAGSGGPWPLVSLTVDDLSVYLALKKSPHKDLGEKYLGLSGFSR